MPDQVLLLESNAEVFTEVVAASTYPFVASVVAESSKWMYGGFAFESVG